VGLRFKILGDPANITDEKMKLLVENREEREKLAKEARKTVEQHFSYRKIAERLIDIYNS